MLTSHALANDRRDVSSLLHGRWGDARQRLPILTLEVRDVARNEDLRMARNVTKWVDEDAPASVNFRAGSIGYHFCELRRCHARCPQNRLGRNALLPPFSLH